MTWDEVKQKLLQKDGVRDEIENCEFEFTLLDEFFSSMSEQNISIDEIKEKMISKQDLITDIESGLFHTAMDLIQKIGIVLGKKPIVKFV